MLRIGLGFDAHRLVEGRKLIVGGVDIPFEKGLEGHSDGDVLLHAIGDAILGAIAEGDLGTHFPPGDDTYRGVSSSSLLDAVLEILGARRYAVENVDCTIIAQEPRLAPFRDRMRRNVADLLAVDMSRVSIKATTTEGMGPEGRGEGISAQAVVLVKAVD